MDDIDEGAVASMAKKRPCCSPPPPPTTTSAMADDRSPYLPSPELNKESLIENFVSSSFSLDASVEKILESIPSDFDKNFFIYRALSRASALADAANRYARTMASQHNSQAWALPPDLTIKKLVGVMSNRKPFHIARNQSHPLGQGWLARFVVVFSMLDIQSLSYAAATCTMFHKCALDPLCYVDIDLRTVVPKVNNGVVAKMIERAGKVLRSLKLGIIPGPRTSYGSSQPLVCTIRNSVEASSFSWNDKRSRQGKETAILTRSCLNSLIGNSSAPGLLLRRLHLYNIDRIDSSALCMALSGCPSLLDLEIVGLHIELRHTLESVSTNCQMLERLSFESSKTGRDDSLKSSTCVDFINSCPRLSSLALRGFKLHDYKVRLLVKFYMGKVPLFVQGFHKLKHVDFSSSYSITGSFLTNIGSSCPVMEVLILRDCMHLKEIDVDRFLTSIIAGDFKSLKHIDISNKEGLASEGDWYKRCYNPCCIPLKQLSKVRPDICVVAEFPPEGSFLEMENMMESDENSDMSLQSEMSSHSGSLFLSSSESSYNSDRGSGNENGREAAGYVMYEESSDEVDFLAL
ncbi:hypothetical protein V2J09_016288 [Rumex salicifolius]